MLKLLCNHSQNCWQVLQNEDNRYPVPSCLHSGEHLCRVVAGSPSPECCKLQHWHQSCCYRFQLQTPFIFTIHYLECVFSACQVLVLQEVWSQLDSCQGYTCYWVSNRLQLLDSTATRQTYMYGKVLLLKLPSSTLISSISVLCCGRPAWITSGEDLREDSQTGTRFTCAVMRNHPLAHLLIQSSHCFLPVQPLAVPFPLLHHLPAGWNTRQLLLFLVHQCSLM